MNNAVQMALCAEWEEAYENEAWEAWEARERDKEERAQARKRESAERKREKAHAKREAAIVEAFRSGKVHPRHKAKAAKAAKLPKIAVPKAKAAKPQGMKAVSDIDAYWKARGL